MRHRLPWGVSTGSSTIQGVVSTRAYVALPTCTFRKASLGVLAGTRDASGIIASVATTPRW